jgi:hypothetical protein
MFLLPHLKPRSNFFSNVDPWSYNSHFELAHDINFHNTNIGFCDIRTIVQHHNQYITLTLLNVRAKQFGRTFAYSASAYMLPSTVSIIKFSTALISSRGIYFLQNRHRTFISRYLHAVGGKQWIHLTPQMKRASSEYFVGLLGHTPPTGKIITKGGLRCTYKGPVLSILSVIVQYK